MKVGGDAKESHLQIRQVCASELSPANRGGPSSRWSATAQEDIMAIINQTTETLRSAADRMSKAAHQVADQAEYTGHRMAKFGRRAAWRSRKSIAALPGAIERHPYRTAGVVAAVGAIATLWMVMRRRR
jgi:ElaB/YqjD/DUF883 family membrane-anchored ribosome-binding protein